jgi:hypothetical protein
MGHWRIVFGYRAIVEEVLATSEAGTDTPGRSGLMSKGPAYQREGE